MPICGGGNNNVKITNNGNNEIKVLLLGAGESGKSTIFKQMKIMHNSGYTKEEREAFREIIFGNIVKAMKVLVAASLSLDIPVEEPENRERAEHINNMDNEVLVNVLKVWNEALAKDIDKLWNDNGIRKTFERRNEFQLDDSAPYYFNDLARISSPDYLPSEQDVLRSRVKTTGIVETEFKLNNQSVKMIDVGGQRNERKKWIHCFENVTAVLFVAGISEYDQMLYEDEHTNRMDEALTLFDEICNSRWFRETAIILFLNKSDLFAEKIKTVPLTVCFPEYAGDAGDYSQGVEFLSEEFENKNRNPDKHIYLHVTCATDTENIAVVFNAVKDIVIRKSLNEAGLV